MKHLKTQIIQAVDRDFSLLTLSAIGCILLLIRVKYTHSFFYTFLIWNLVLAWVPYGIVLLAKTIKKRSFLKLASLSLMWLLFLPNAPYIVTDAIHLQLSPGHLLWYDVLLILTFALAGLYCYLFSVKELIRLWQPYLSTKGLRFLQFCIPFITALGIYLGRFLRFNSWDIITAPYALFSSITEVLFLSKNTPIVWGFILIFGSFLWLLKKGSHKFL